MKDRNDFHTKEEYMDYLYNYTLIETMKSILIGGLIHPGYTSDIKKHSISITKYIMDDIKCDK